MKRFSVCRDVGIEVRFEIRTFENELLEGLFVIDPISPDSRQLTDYSKVTLLERVKEIYSDGKKIKVRWGD